MQAVHEGFSTNFLRGPFDAFFGNVGSAKTNVTFDRAAEKKYLLQHYGEVFPERLQVPLA